MISPSQAVAKWQRNATPQAYTEGIQGTTVNPMERAAAQEDRMLAGVQEAVQSGRWAARLRAVPVERWKSQSVAKGAPNYGNGIRSSVADTTAAFTDLFSAIASVKQQVDALPKGTKGNGLSPQSLERMRVMADGMSRYKRNAGRR